jgi:SAM-dependent methyltransferase
MTPLAESVASYDRVARWYDVDMARNMTHDDAGLYRLLARRAGGRVLELGCGNGRILLELLADGRDAVGVDRSAGMLRELGTKATARGLVPRVARMDARALALAPGFSLVLCPYSLITYMTGDEDAARLCAEARRVLGRSGGFVIDAFVPRHALASEAFREDYRRPCEGGELERSRRITALSGGLHRVERRYVLRDAAGRPVDRAETAEVIRPYSPDDLRTLLARAGFAVEDVWWDYGARGSSPGAQFVTMLARPRG